MIEKKIHFEKDITYNKNMLSNKICNKNILVIGGAGTIGSSYIKQILKYKPSKVTIVDINENGLTELTRDLRSSNLLDYNPEYITYPVNLLSDTFDKIFKSDSWHVVANFSAHKHVRSEKLPPAVAACARRLAGPGWLVARKRQDRARRLRPSPPEAPFTSQRTSRTGTCIL